MEKGFEYLRKFQPVAAQIVASYDFSMPVNSDSMSPYINRGDIIACSKVNIDDLKPGHIYVVDMDEAAYINRVYEVPGDDGKLNLVSDNAKYPDYCINKSDVYNVYRVIGMIRVVV